jgi:hypothetical protein
MLLMLYGSLVRMILEYAFVVCNFLSGTGANKLEPVQRELSALYITTDSLKILICSYNYVLDKLNLYILHDRWRDFEALFIMDVYNGFI